ncbi:hypothetical protein FDX19_15615 [Citrobacter sp. wls619]|uniref:hypothetical protein n=1 Tax=Citrobacter sp. wls619 TaxID=2576432 RepID=UPI0010C9A886|nr:hypothetical protein [Citrobacter sp. wls619]TKV08264.1 hypothetical protein FDX19_15615 [Citrobacter sp. wls619]
MSSKPAHARKEQQIQKSALRREQVKQAISEVSKAQLREMRKLGFAPRKGVVTQRHFERYAAHLETLAMSRRADALNNEVSVFVERGGLMAQIFDRLESPGIKATAFANLATTATRLLSLAPTLADKSRAALAGQSDAYLSDSDLDAIERDVMKGVSSD